MLKRLSVQGYKSLQSVEVVLQPLSVLFGPNAAGKSNCLDALQLLSRLATAKTLKEAFQPPYRGTPIESFTFGAEGIKGLLARDTVSFTIEVDVELSPRIVESVNARIREMRRPKSQEQGQEGERAPSFVRETRLRYRVAIEMLPKSGILRVADEYLTALNSKGQPTKSRNAFIERVKNRLVLRMERQSHPSHHDTELDRTLLSLPHYPPHHPHVVAMREELASWLLFYFEPRERMRAPNPVKEVRHIGLMGEDLAAFLNTLNALDKPQFRAVERALRAIIPSITGLRVDVSDLGEVELKIMEGSRPVPARVVSEGTLRTIGLLALSGAKEPPALVGFEEPENGIHPRRIELIARLLHTRSLSAETQIIATTHSPLLLDLIPPQSLFLARKRSGLTEIVPFDPSWPLGARAEINDSLNEEEVPPKVSELVTRGALDD